MKVNLLPRGKVDKWTVSYFDENGDNHIEDFDSKEDVFMQLIEMQEEYDMNTVVVYPPNSNVTYEELLAM